MKNNLRKNNAITLIALVITIIVLLILVGVTIASLTGENGLLNRATEAKDATQKSELIDKVRSEILAKIIDKHGKNLDEEEIKAILSEAGFIVNNNTDLTDQETILTTNNGISITVGELMSGITMSPKKVIGSSLLWKLNDAGDTIVGYLGTEPIEGDTLIIPNYVEDENNVVHKITKLGSYSTDGGLKNGRYGSNYMASISNGKKLIISHGIESIDRQFFDGCSEFTGDLKIPNSVVSIGIACFNGCSGFNGVLDLPSSVTTIGNSCFTFCTGRIFKDEN